MRGRSEGEFGTAFLFVAPLPVRCHQGLCTSQHCVQSMTVLDKCLLCDGTDQASMQCTVLSILCNAMLVGFPARLLCQDRLLPLAYDAGCQACDLRAMQSHTISRCIEEHRC